MHDLSNHTGIFSPEDLRKMSEELDRGAVSGETPDGREMRAEAIIYRAGLKRGTRTSRAKKTAPAVAPVQN